MTQQMTFTVQKIFVKKSMVITESEKLRKSVSFINSS